jgi:two-component system, OmpR family, phosphate regulon response regulator PhoB
MTAGSASNRRETRVLVVDDDPEVRMLITDLLGDEGFKCEATDSADAALTALREHPADVVLLDVTMPTMSGLDLMSEIRKHSEVPIIFVTGKGAETDKVLGLRMGADDYVTKPFSQAELIARIHSVLRRAHREPTGEQRLEFGELVVDLQTREVLVKGDVIDTTAKEFDLLVFLAQAPRRVFSREQILKTVWDSSANWQDAATVTEHVRRLRKKIEKNPDEPRWLRTVRGVGYRFEP